MATFQTVIGKCGSADPTYRKYLRATIWIEGCRILFCMKVLGIHRETVESRAPKDQGGDGTMPDCQLTRRRGDIINMALAHGWQDPGQNDSEPVPTDQLGRPPCPASDFIRKLVGPNQSHAYIVGKGPSIDALTAADFGQEMSPILCCNESVHVIEGLGLTNPVFGIQQDARLGERARPKNAYWLLSRQAWRAGNGDTHPGAIQYDPVALGGATKSLTANQAQRILGIAGFRRVTMVGFDGCTSGNLGYAPSTGSDPTEWKQNPSRFTGYCRTMERVAGFERMRLAWQPPHDFWTVACVLRTGGTYTAAHVEWLRRQVANRLQTPHRFVCLSNDRALPNRIPLLHEWPGWWSKVELFRPGLFAGGVLYLDLDVVLSRDFALPAWDTLEPGQLYGRPDFAKVRADAGEINSSVVLWRDDAGAAIYGQMLDDADGVMGRHHKHGDQAFESEVMRGRISAPPLVVSSYKADKGAAHADTDVMVFHGQPKPWDVDVPWIPALKGPQAATVKAARRWRWEYLAELVNVNKITTAAEVGVKEGKTSEALLRDCPTLRKLYSIDLFQGQPDVKDMERAAESYTKWDWAKIIAEYRTRIEPYRARCVTIIGDAIEAAAMIPEPLGLAFLDADHREEPTRQAIRVWRERVKPGGILAGHDIDWDTVKRAVESECPGYEVGPDNVWTWIIPETLEERTG